MTNLLTRHLWTLKSLLTHLGWLYAVSLCFYFHVFPPILKFPHTHLDMLRVMPVWPSTIFLGCAAVGWDGVGAVLIFSQERENVTP